MGAHPLTDVRYSSLVDVFALFSPAKECMHRVQHYSLAASQAAYCLRLPVGVGATEPPAAVSGLSRLTPELVKESAKEALQALDRHHPGEEGEAAA